MSYYHRLRSSIIAIAPHARGKTQLCKTNYWRKKIANGWTPERRARQAELIRTWRPWEKSTRPKTETGKAKSIPKAWIGSLPIPNPQGGPVRVRRADSI